MALAEAGVVRPNQRHLLGAQLDLLAGSSFFQLEQALVVAAQSMFDEDILHRRRSDLDAFQSQQDTAAHRPTRANYAWQAKTEGAYSADQFVVGWENEQVICP